MLVTVLFRCDDNSKLICRCNEETIAKQCYMRARRENKYPAKPFAYEILKEHETAKQDTTKTQKEEPFGKPTRGDQMSFF